MPEVKLKERMDFLDIVKGIGGIWMIHRHVVNSLLNPNIKIPWYYPDFMQGLAAPCFLLSAGFVLVFLFESAKKKNEISKRIQRLLYRCAQIILLGYSLQLPYFSLRRMLMPLTEQEKIFFFHANVLQCIGLSLILLALFILLLKRIDTVIAGYCAGAIGLLLIIVSPWVGNHVHFPIYIQSYFTFKQFSLFPLFPFTGILFFGAAMGSFYMHMKAINKTKTAFCIFLILGILFMLLRYTPFNAKYASLEIANPVNYFHKIGEGLAAFGVSYFLAKISGFFKRIVDVLLLMGKEALFVYAIHLIILYGYPFNFGFVHNFANSLSYSTATLLTILILVLTIIFSWLWAKLKERSITAARVIIGILALVFIFKPW